MWGSLGSLLGVDWLLSAPWPSQVAGWPGFFLTAYGHSAPSRDVWLAGLSARSPVGTYPVLGLCRLLSSKTGDRAGRQLASWEGLGSPVGASTSTAGLHPLDFTFCSVGVMGVPAV